MTDPSLIGLRTVGLTRSSSNSQTGEGLSNDQQLDILKSYSDANQMIWVAEERAEGISGSDIYHRPDIDNLIYRATIDKDYDVLLVQSYDRLTRGGADHGAHLIHEFAQLGIRIISTSNDIPEDDEYASVIRSIEFIKGEGTARSISLYTSRGSTASILEDRSSYSRNVPYGLDRLILSAAGEPLFRIRNYPDGTQAKLHVSDDAQVIEKYPRNQKKGPFRHFLKGVDQKIVLVNGAPDAVANVRMMMDMFWVKGIGTKTCMKTLNAQGSLSPRGHAWSDSAVYGIVMNPIYVQRGISNQMTSAKFHKRTSIAGEKPIRIKQKPKNKTPLYRPESEWIIKIHPEIDIVPLELRDHIWKQQYERMLSKVHKDGIVRHRTSMWNSKYLLHGSIFDWKTGKRLTPQTCGRKKNVKSEGCFRYYGIRDQDEYWKINPENGKRRRFVNAVAAENAVLKCFGEVMENLDGFRPVLEQYAAQRLSAKSRDVQCLSDLQAERKATVEKKLFVLEEYGDVGRDELRKKIEPMTAKIKELDLRIENAMSSCNLTGSSAEEVVSSVLKQVKEVGSCFGEPSSAALRSALNVMTKTKVDIQTGEAEIELRVPEEAWRHPAAISRLRAASTLPTKSARATQHESAVILAKFQCVTERVKHSTCLQCTRVLPKAA